MIESYSFGSIVINGKRYNSDCIITKDSVSAKWWRRKGHELCIDDIKDVIEKEKPEAIVVGKGKFGLMRILKETEDYLENLGIELYSDKTDEAVKHFNDISQVKKVVAFFHLTC